MNKFNIKIGVAIPAYNGHINQLYSLLNSIQQQTVIPDKVVVSCSSTNVFENNIDYKFPLEIIITMDKKNAAENRNISASYLNDMDYITFIDADDIMHYQRIEILLKVIELYNSDIILHNFSIDSENNIFNNITNNILVRNNTLCQSSNGCITHVNGYNDTIDKIHHSQVTVKNNIFNIIKFPEESKFNRKEDSVFCYNVFNLPNIKHSYILNKLSFYNPSNTIF